MIITINHASDEPIYLQLRSQIISAIAQGELAAGSRLPAVRQLSADLGINLHTVNKAYAVLRDEGYIVMRSRTGAVVADRPSASRKGEALSSEAAERLSGQLNRLLAEHKAAGNTAESFMAIVQREVEAVYGASAALPSVPSAGHGASSSASSGASSAKSNPSHLE